MAHKTLCGLRMALICKSACQIDLLKLTYFLDSKGGRGGGELAGARKLVSTRVYFVLQIYPRSSFIFFYFLGM